MLHSITATQTDVILMRAIKEIPEAKFHFLTLMAVLPNNCFCEYFNSYCTLSQAPLRTSTSRSRFSKSNCNQYLYKT